MMSHGYSKRYMQLSIATSIITSISFIAGVSFGINGIATAYAIASFMVLIPMYIISFRGIPMKRSTIYKTILWPLISVLASGLLVYVLMRFVTLEGALGHLIIAFTFFLTYTGLTWARAETRATLRSIWQSVVSKKKTKAE